MRPSWGRKLGKKKDASLSLLSFSFGPCFTMRSFCRPDERLLFDIDLERLGRGPSADDDVPGGPFLSLREIGLVMPAISGAEPHFKAGEVADTVESSVSEEGKAL